MRLAGRTCWRCAARAAAFRGGAVSMVFQEPMTALDPVYTIGQQIAETIRQHRAAARRRPARARSSCWTW